MSRRIAGSVAWVGVAIVQLLYGAEALGRRYSLTEIPHTDAESVGALRINDAGQVVGIIDHVGEPRRPWNGFVWSRDSGRTDLGEGPGAFSINNDGVVVGRRYDPEEGHDAFLWTAAGGVRLLSSLPGGEPFASASISEAVDVNNAGQIVGHISTNGGDSYAFVREPNGTIRRLPMPPGSNPYSRSGPVAFGMNDRGDVVGRVGFGEGDYRAYVWTAEGGYRDLGDLPGGLEQGTAVAINNRGEIVGSALGPQDPNVPHTAGQRAVRFLEDGTIRELGVPLGMSDSAAEDINDFGEIVGRSRLGPLDGLGALLWTEREGMLNLNDLLDESGRGWTLLWASSINNVGQIVVGGEFQGRTTNAVLTPVPEPTGAVAVLVLLRWAVRRRGRPRRLQPPRVVQKES